MPDNEDRSLIPLPDSSLANTAAGAKRIMSEMVGGTLALTRQEDTRVQAAKRRIGEYEFCQPDYRQIFLWAEALNLDPMTVVARLLDDGTFFGIRSPCHSPDWALTRFKDGRIETLYWDRRLLPLRKFEWVEGLEITSVTFSNEEQPPWDISELPLPLPKLRWLSCEHLGLTELDLSSVKNLEGLECFGNKLVSLDLSRVPKLAKLVCWNNPISELELSGVPRLTQLVVGSTKRSEISELDLSCVPNLAGLICYGTRLSDLDLSNVPQLTELMCPRNDISDLDLSRVPNLTNLDCRQNKLSALDLSRVPKLTDLDCWANNISDLDLSCVPDLVRLSCNYNDIAELDISNLEHLECVRYDKERTRLIQRPDQHFDQ